MGRRKNFVILSLLACVLAVSAVAEVKNVELSGQIRIRGNYINNQLATPAPQMRHSPLTTLGRPIGGPFGPAVMSMLDWDNEGPDFSSFEQRTKLGVRATFTDNVSSFIEIDSYDNWGEDFRSNYLTGADNRAASGDDVEIFQAYVEADEMFGAPLRLRAGRQELAFGSQWLVGARDFAFLYTGLSFDAVRLTYTMDTVTVDAWASKVAERLGDFGEDDIDFYGVYASCTAVEGHTFDAYWMLLDDNTDGTGNTNLNTVGLRGAGKCGGAFDYDVEVAYQFGSADAYGYLAGDHNAEFDTWGAKLDLGYTVDMAMHPRFFISGRYYGGEDNRDISFIDWVNPFDRPSASVSFNRLFSNEINTGFIDLLNDLSNAWTARVGVMAAPMEKIRTVFAVSYYEALEPFDRPVMPVLTWWTRTNEKDMGWELTLFNEYLYSDDLTFEFGWAHLFTGDGLGEGNFSAWNGTILNGGSDDDDADYVYAGCKISF